MKTVNKKNYIKFLMFIEYYYHWCQTRGTEAMFCKQNIAGYLNINYRTLLRYFDRIDTTKHNGEGLITFIEKKTARKKDGKLSEWEMSVYTVDCDKVLDTINKYVPYTPTEEERKAKFSSFFSYSHKASCTPEELEIEEKEQEVKNRKKAKKEKIKKEKNKQYIEDYGYIIDLLDEVNNLRINYPLREINTKHPEGFKSNYLKEGRNRERNYLCGTKKPNNYPEGTPKNAKERYQVIHGELGIDYDDIGEWDENASIFRTEYFLNHGKRLPRYIDGKKVDLYEVIWNNCNYGKEWNGTVRNNFKAVFMPLYMKDCANRGEMNRSVCGFSKNKPKKKIKDALIYLKNYIYPEMNTFAGIKKILDKLSVELKKFLGADKFQKDRIFILESNTFVIMQHTLWTAGIPAINVYDCCYFDKSKISQEEVERIHDEAMIEALRIYKPLEFKSKSKAKNPRSRKTAGVN